MPKNTKNHQSSPSSLIWKILNPHHLPKSDSRMVTGGRKEQKIYKINRRLLTKTEIVNEYLSILTLKVNRLNPPVKRHRMAEWIKWQLYDAYKKLASGLRLHDWKWKEGIT